MAIEIVIVLCLPIHTFSGKAIFVDDRRTVFLAQKYKLVMLLKQTGTCSVNEWGGGACWEGKWIESREKKSN